MVVIEATYAGQLRTRITHGPSGAELATDAPKDNHGRGESFSPTDLVGVALGSCMLTVMGIVAQRHGWNMEGATARVEKHMVADPDRRIGRLVATVTLPSGLPPAAHAALEQSARNCPVHHTLHPDTEVELCFETNS